MLFWLETGFDIMFPGPGEADVHWEIWNRDVGEEEGAILLDFWDRREYSLFNARMEGLRRRIIDDEAGDSRFDTWHVHQFVMSWYHNTTMIFKS